MDEPMNDATWTNYWLDNSLWDTPPDTDADVRRTTEWQHSYSNHPSNRPLQYQTIDTLDTATDSRAMLTADGQIGLWIKVDPDVFHKWELRASTIGCPQDDDFDSIEEWVEYDLAHDWSLHQVAQDWANWFQVVTRLGTQLGWA